MRSGSSDADGPGSQAQNTSAVIHSPTNLLCILGTVLSTADRAGAKQRDPCLAQETEAVGDTDMHLSFGRDSRMCRKGLMETGWIKETKSCRRGEEGEPEADRGQSLEESSTSFQGARDCYYGCGSLIASHPRS